MTDNEHSYKTAESCGGENHASMKADEIILRLKSNWLLKLVLGVGLIVMFAVLYILPQRYPVFPVITMQPAWIDRMIPFMPGFVYLYESLYLIMPIAPWLMTSKNELARYSMGLVFMSSVGFCFFFFWPTLSPRPIDIHNANMLYRNLITFDNELNAFPSLHVAYALFHSACCHKVFRAGPRHNLLRWSIWIWALGISLSTLPTKQHVFVDVVGGAILGLGSFAIYYRTIGCQGDLKQT